MCFYLLISTFPLIWVPAMFQTILYFWKTRIKSMYSHSQVSFGDKLFLNLKVSFFSSVIIRFNRVKKSRFITDVEYYAGNYKPCAESALPSRSWPNHGYCQEQVLSSRMVYHHKLLDMLLQNFPFLWASLIPYPIAFHRAALRECRLIDSYFLVWASENPNMPFLSPSNIQKWTIIVLFKLDCEIRY